MAASRAYFTAGKETQSPPVIRHLESPDVVLLGSVHTPGRNVPLIPGAIDRFAPGFVAVELTEPDRKTGAMDVDAVSEKCRGRIVCVDRAPEVTSSRYLCGTRPLRYLRGACTGTSGCRSTRPQY